MSGFNSPLKRSSSSCDVHTTVANCGSLASSGRAFESGCICHNSSAGVYNDLRGRATECQCGAPRLQPQLLFVDALMGIGKRLSALSTKEQRSRSRSSRLFLYFKSRLKGFCLKLTKLLIIPLYFIFLYIAAVVT